MVNQGTHFSKLLKSTALIGVTILGLGVAAPVIPVLSVAAATSTTTANSATAVAPITTDPSISEAIPTDAGIEPYSQFQVTTTAGTTVTGPAEQSGATIMKAIIDRTQFASLGLLSTLRNTTSTTQTVNTIFNLPNSSPQNGSTITASANAAPTITGATGLTIYYRGTASKYLTLAAYQASGQSWSELKALQVKGALASGQTVQITTPFTVTGLSTADLTKNTNTMLKTSTFNYSTNGHRTLITNGQIWFADALNATYSNYNTVQGSGRATSDWDSATQNLISGLIPSADISGLDFAGGSTGTALFSTGNVAVDLSRIKAAVNPEGYSVALDSTGDQRATYTYPTSNNMSGALDIQLIKVLATENSTLAVGDPWLPENNLIAATSPVNGTDVRGQVTTTGTVDTSKAGTYHVTYSYRLGTSTISKTATITVESFNDLGDLLDTSTINSAGLDSEGNTSATPNELGGYQHYAQFAVTDTTGATAYSPLSNDTGTTPNAIVNAAQFKSLALLATIKNTSDHSTRIRTAFSLPAAWTNDAKTRLYALASAGATAVAGSAKGLSLYYSNGDGSYFPLAEFLSENNNDYSKIALILVDGTLHRGQGLQLSVPLTVSNDSGTNLTTAILKINNNDDQALTSTLRKALTFSSHTYAFSNPTATINSSTGKLSSYTTYADSGVNNGVLFALPVKPFTQGYLATYLTSGKNYVIFDDAVQSLLADLGPIDPDLSFKNYVANTNDFIGYADKATGNYTTGSLKVDLTRVKAAVNSEGLSVVVANGSQVAAYTYRTGTSNSFSLTNPDGSYPGSTQNKQQYIELIRVLDTTDSEFRVGSAAAKAWTTTTNLIPGKDPETKTALTTKDYTVTVTDAQGRTVTDPETTLRKTPGVYTVNYTYQLTGSVISKKAVVTVLADQRSLSASDFTMTSGDTTPTITDFQVSATDSDGNALNAPDITLDLSQADLNKIGQYPVTITTSDGQLTTVTLTIKAAVPDNSNGGATDNNNGSANETGHQSGPNTTGQPNKPTNDLNNVILPITGTNTAKSIKTAKVKANGLLLPQTDEQVTKGIITIGLALLGATSIILGSMITLKKRRQA
ncbi:bacterial Ig-like domain-containing protein [Lapidilactobacillus luobeiensis]|uniref:bacterial Ig-like domain-containing protein n=1 Tax=Lapidilactobacillus luobeiensis TaxID=2950371 RepID=UPI0021C311F4|nr:bacterial Ig-like domain-containing protein [Lapidilactobacillus luobeiensis]